MEQKKRIRVVVASPSDVQIERDLLPDVLDELNHGIGELSNLYFELYRWETEAYPGFHPHGPQGLIDSVLRIEECDILIVIFWKRFGTLVEDGQTGTEHEFRIAYNAWEKKGRPQIMVYFNKKLYRINTSSEMHQLEALLNFKNNFPKKGLWWDYEGADEFKDLVRKHLTQFVKYLSPTFAPFMAPPDLPQFTAREKELYQLKQKLQDKVGSLVVLCSLTGYGGVGKSALAAHFANKFCSIFPDGIFWARVDSDTPIDVARNIATALNEKIGVIKSDIQAHTIIQRLLSGKHCLLVLDNADGKYATQRIRFMQPGIKTVSVLVTTRDKSLSSALGACMIELNSFNIKEGISHFKKVLGNDPRIEKEQIYLHKIVEVLGGLPLAVDIAAQTLAWQRDISFDQYFNELRIEDLKAADKGVAATLNKSMILLNPDEQKTFISIGACSLTGFSIETAMAVAQINDRRKIMKLLNKFNTLSMIQRRIGNRFTLHPLVRSFVRIQKGIDKADCRHAKYWYTYVKRYNHDSIEDWDALTVEWDGIRIAWDWCLDVIRKGFRKKAPANQNIIDCFRWTAEIAFNLRYFLDGRGHWQDALKRMSDSLKAANRIEDEKEFEFRIRRHLALLLRKTGKYNKAANYNEVNIDFAKKLKRDDWVGQELEQLGRVRVRQKRYNEAEKLYINSLNIARSLGEKGKRYEGQSLNCLGELYRRKKNFEKSINYFEDALELYKKLNDKQGISSSKGHIGDVYLDMNRLDEAIWYYSSAISVFEWSGKTEVEGSLCQNLGFALQKLKRSVDALSCFIISSDICAQLGIKGWGSKSPFEARDHLLNTIGKNANSFRIRPDNPATQVLSNARNRIVEVIEKILALSYL